VKNYPTWLEKLILVVSVFVISVILFYAATACSKPKKARFYDFSDQLINGEIKKPAAIYMESRSRAKFKKLLSLKKSFRQTLIKTNQDPILK
jgi:hypothetical protein